jgi:hypothetical protein
VANVRSDPGAQEEDLSRSPGSPPGSSEHLTLAEVLERKVGPEAFAAAVEALRRRVEAEGERELLTLQFYADPHSTRIGAVLTFASSAAFLRHVALVGGWDEFRTFAACARLLDIRVYGELPAEAAAWVGQFGAIGQTFPQHITGFVRPQTERGPSP